MSAALIATSLFLGAAFTAVAGLGLLRLPDVYVRMHASTKAGTLGAGLILLGVALHFGTPDTVARALVVALFLMLTAPMAAHLIGRAAYRSGIPPWRGDKHPGTADERASNSSPAVGLHTDGSPTHDERSTLS